MLDRHCYEDLVELLKDLVDADEVNFSRLHVAKEVIEVVKSSRFDQHISDEVEQQLVLLFWLKPCVECLQELLDDRVTVLDVLGDEDFEKLLEQLGWLFDKSGLVLVSKLQVDAGKLAHRKRVLQDATVSFLMKLVPYSGVSLRYKRLITVLLEARLLNVGLRWLAF